MSYRPGTSQGLKYKGSVGNVQYMQPPFSVMTLHSNILSHIQRRYNSQLSVMTRLVIVFPSLETNDTGVGGLFVGFYDYKTCIILKTWVIGQPVFTIM